MGRRKQAARGAYAFSDVILLTWRDLTIITCLIVESLYNDLIIIRLAHFSYQKAVIYGGLHQFQDPYYY